MSICAPICRVRLGIGVDRFTFKFQGLDQKLIGVEVAKELLAYGVESRQEN